MFYYVIDIDYLFLLCYLPLTFLLPPFFLFFVLSLPPFLSPQCTIGIRPPALPLCDEWVNPINQRGREQGLLLSFNRQLRHGGASRYRATAIIWTFIFWTRSRRRDKYIFFHQKNTYYSIYLIYSMDNEKLFPWNHFLSLQEDSLLDGLMKLKNSSLNKFRKLF